MQSTKKLSMYFKSLLFILSLAVFFQACSSKKITVYNQSASYWYNEMIASINQGDLDAADDTYTSLNSEHRNSPLIPTSLVILANAHVEDEEYELANYYLDEYLKRFAQSKNVDYVRYFKIKSKFLAFNSEFRNQKLVSEILDEIQEFIGKFPKSKYLPLVHTMNTRLGYAKAIFDDEIAALYTRIDKPQAAAIYKKRVENSAVNLEEVEKVHTPWYKRIFQ